MAPEPHCLDDRRFVDERKHLRAGPGDHICGFGAQSTNVAPLIANGAGPPPLMTKSQRLADLRAISAGSRGLAARRWRFGTYVHRLAHGHDRNEWLVGRPNVAAQLDTNVGAGLARQIEHQFEPAASTIGNWLLSGSNGSPGWPSTATMWVFAPHYRDGRQTRGRGAAETQPHTGAGSGLQLSTARPRHSRKRRRPCARFPGRWQGRRNRP